MWVLRKVPILDFYPRSPCGERRSIGVLSRAHKKISIHALLAESDLTSVVSSIGTMDFYPRSPCGERHNADYNYRSGHPISIHALLAESDMMV